MTRALSFHSSVCTRLRVGVAIALAGLLAACGGGRSAQDPASDPLAAAALQAKLSASFQPAAQQVTLSWTDTFTNESGFRIERLSGADWVAVVSVPAASGSGSILS